MKPQDEINAQFKKNMRMVFWLFVILFIILSASFVKLVIADSQTFISNPFNKRMTLTDSRIKRGSILDSEGKILAESEKTDDVYIRKYPYKNVLSHAIGYSAFGKAGIENKFNFKLQGVDWEIVQRLSNFANGDEITANNLVLTANADFSKYITEKLGNRKGAVIAMEPATGKILAMVSYNDFNPEDIYETWDALYASEHSPLLNRAIQGTFIPGSTFKIVTAVAAIESIPDLDGYTYECMGEAEFNGNKMVCNNSKAHGKVDFKKAFAVSCNTYFASISQNIPPEKMREVATRFYIDKPYYFDLDYVSGSFTLGNDATTSEMIETAIGQGKTIATPLNMALVTSAVANGGLLMKPYIVDRVETPDGSVKEKYYPKALGQVIAPSIAEEISEMMVECVKTGTGAPAALKTIQAAGKTGTAQNPAGDDHSWFVGFAPAEKPKIAFAIVLENSGGGGKSLQLGKDLLTYYFLNMDTDE